MVVAFGAWRACRSIAESIHHEYVGAEPLFETLDVGLERAVKRRDAAQQALLQIDEHIGAGASPRALECGVLGQHLREPQLGQAALIQSSQWLIGAIS